MEVFNIAVLLPSLEQVDHVFLPIPSLLHS